MSTAEARSQYLTMTDVHNIRREYGIVEDDMKRLTVMAEDDDIVYFKPKRVFSDNYPFLDPDHFVLILQTEYHPACMERYGDEVVSIDATHGICIYGGFKSVTLIVLDESESSIFVGHCLTDPKDTNTMKVFFLCLQSRCPGVSAEWLISDGVDATFDSWMIGPRFYRRYRQKKIPSAMRR